MADKIVVMTNKAIEFLVSVYNVPEEKIALIEHGVPDIHYSQAKSKRSLSSKVKKCYLHSVLLDATKELKR